MNGRKTRPPTPKAGRRDAYGRRPVPREPARDQRRKRYVKDIGSAEGENAISPRSCHNSCALPRLHAF
jgi:hypothetical protein